MKLERPLFSTTKPSARRGADLLTGVSVIRDRAIYPSAYSCGATIYDGDAGLRHATEARAEFAHVLEAVKGALGMNSMKEEAA
jgi:hypothetical protein